MRAVDDELSTRNGCGAAVGVVARQSPVARTLFVDGCGAGVCALQSCGQVIDDAAERLVAVGVAHIPHALVAGRLLG